MRQGRRFFYTLVPAVLMLATTVTMLALELNRFLHMPGLTPPQAVPWDLVVSAAAIMALTLGLVVMSLRGIRQIVRERRGARAAG